MIKLYTSNNCPQCVEVKQALKAEGLDFIEHNMSLPESATAMFKDCEERELDPRSFRQAPAMFVADCKVAWAGAECLIAIEEREWEDFR